MLNIVFGLIAICLGIWGLIKYWWYITDVLIAVFPLVLIFVGAVALMAGIKNTGLKAIFREGNDTKEEAEPKIRKRDE